MRTTALFLCGSLWALPLSAAEQPASLVADPIADAVALAEVVGEGVIRFGGFVLDLAALKLDTFTRANNFLGEGTLPENYFTVTDSDPPNDRALKIFLSELRGRLIACEDKQKRRWVATRMPISLIKKEFIQTIELRPQWKEVNTPLVVGNYVVLASQITVSAGVALEKPTPAEEANNMGTALRYTFTVSFRGARFKDTNLAADVFVWSAPPSGQGDYAWQRAIDEQFSGPWQCQVRLQRRTDRLEEILPKPPQVKILKEFPFLPVDCAEVPRPSAISQIIQEVSTLPEEEKLLYLKVRSDKGEPDAMAVYGQRLTEGGGADFAIGLDRLKRAAALGSGEAAWELGERHLSGDGVPKDHAKALTYYAIAKQEGYLIPASGRLLQMQVGKQNSVKAEREVNALFEQYPTSFTLPLAMAFYHADAKNPARDLNRAAAMFSKAATNGSTQAFVILARSSLFGHGSRWAEVEQASALYGAASDGRTKSLSPREAAAYQKEIDTFFAVFRPWREKRRFPLDPPSKDELQEFQETFINRLPFQLEFPLK